MHSYYERAVEGLLAQPTPCKFIYEFFEPRAGPLLAALFFLAPPLHFDRRMNRVLALVLLAAGAILLVFGLNASESVSSEISEVFTGEPTDRAMWMMIGGGILAALGVGALFMPKRT